jgi:predicted Zn-dependent protease
MSPAAGPEGADPLSSFTDVAAALDRGEFDRVVAMTEGILGAHPGDDAAHELRARALLALGRVDEAERHAADAVRLDPEEIRYRELLAQVLSRAGAHRDAAAEFGRLARNDPRQAGWTVAEARERIDAAQPAMGVEAARRAVQLEPGNGAAQLTLARALVRAGDAEEASRASARAVALLPADPTARETLADARWLAGDDSAALAAFGALAGGLEGRDRDRVTAKARALVRRRGGVTDRLLAAIGPIFAFAFRRGWVRGGR